VAADRGLLVNGGLVSIGLFSGKSRFFQRVCGHNRTGVLYPCPHFFISAA